MPMIGVSRSRTSTASASSASIISGTRPPVPPARILYTSHRSVPCPSGDGHLQHSTKAVAGHGVAQLFFAACTPLHDPVPHCTMRSTPRFTALAALCLAMLCTAPLRAQTPLPSIADKTRGMEKRDGFLPVYWEAATGKLWMEIPRTGQELIYVVSLPAGLGSNDIGLDRGQLGGERLVRFDRVGPRVLMVQPNQAYRATTDEPGGAARGGGVVRAVGAVGIRGQGGAGRAGAGGCDRLRAPRRARRGPRAAPRAPGRLQAGRLAQRPVSAEHEGVPAQHGDRGDAHLYRRQPRAAGCATWRRRPRPSACGSGTRSSRCRRRGTSRAAATRGPASSASTTTTSRRRWARRSRSASSAATGWRSATPARR